MDAVMTNLTHLAGETTSCSINFKVVLKRFPFMKMDFVLSPHETFKIVLIHFF